VDKLEPSVHAVSWKPGGLQLLDQTLLPGQETYIQCHRVAEVTNAIKILAVRGAPAIGVAAAYGAVLAFDEAASADDGKKQEIWERSLEELIQSRPTAVNLSWAVNRMQRCWENLGGKFERETRDQLEKEAHAIAFEDLAANQRMAQLGANLLGSKNRLLTHCNTGDLATSGVGTAFGVLRQAYIEGKVQHVYACEARPVLQGLRLTAWELEKNEIPFSVICDSMAGSVIREKGVTAVFLGADRVAANGDVANKVGTYNLAVLAKHHGIAFYVVAPTSTFDLSLPNGDSIPIEVREDDEILDVLGARQGKTKFPVFNPAFDRTPAELITAIICEKGVIESPTESNVREILGSDA